MQKSKISIRPQINTTIITKGITDTEWFQNQILRPILKLQHDLLIIMFKNAFQKKRNIFYNLSTEKKEEYVEQLLRKDVNFRNQLTGSIIGLLTVEEYVLYLKQYSELNKRIVNMIKQRVLSQL